MKVGPSKCHMLPMHAPRLIKSCLRRTHPCLICIPLTKALPPPPHPQVRDAVFLHGYTEPVLLLLYECTPTWAARLRERKDTCAVAAVCISLRRKRHTVLWREAGLPFDAQRLVAVPGRTAALVLCSNMVVYVSQVRPPCMAHVHRCSSEGRPWIFSSRVLLDVCGMSSAHTLSVGVTVTVSR